LSLHPAWKRPRRKQLNVSAEAERMLEALLRQERLDDWLQRFRNTLARL
jgi:hypothetical protein